MLKKQKNNDHQVFTELGSQKHISFHLLFKDSCFV